MSMEKRISHYVIFWAPGSFTANEWTVEASSDDPRAIQWPDNAYAFRMFRREDVVDGETVYQGKPEQLGPIYYHPDSFVQTLDQVKGNPAATPILLDNMRINAWDRIIWTRWGNWPQAFNAEKMEILR